MTLHYADDSVTLYLGDSLTVARELASSSVDCIVTSPPYYGLRDYGIEGQYGLEASPAAYVETMRALFSELRRALSPDGTLWLNIGDSYASAPKGSLDTGKSTLNGGNQNGTTPVGLTRKINWAVPHKNLLGIPWRVAFALQDDGWILRSAIVWHKSNAMPESVTDRVSSRYEMVFMFSKSPKYWFDLDVIREPTEYVGKTWEERKALGEPMRYGLKSAAGVGARDFKPSTAGRNPGDVWVIPTTPFRDGHFAVMPQSLAERAIQAGCPPQRCRMCGKAPTRTTGDFVPDMSRAQTQRAYQLAEAAGLTPAHYAAIRAGGLSRAGKVDGQHTQKNDPEVERLAAEVRAALGGNYSELLRGTAESTGWTDCGHNDYRPGVVLDPFTGSGTTGLAAAKHGRGYVGIDLNVEYLDLSLRTRLLQPGLFEQGA